MINSFNTNIAVKFGIDTAIFVQQLAQWSFINLANKRNIHDGHVWTYNTLEAFEQIFPYWTYKQLRRVISNAMEQGLVIKANYNQTKYDRTCWYALTQAGMDFFPELLTEKNTEALNLPSDQPETIDLPKWADQVAQKGGPIPTNNPTNCLLNKKTLSKQGKFSLSLRDLLKDNPHKIPEPMIQDWLTNRKAKKAVVTETAWNRINKQLVKIYHQCGIEPEEAFERMVTAGWLSLEVQYFSEEQIRKGQLRVVKTKTKPTTL